MLVFFFLLIKTNDISEWCWDRNLQALLCYVAVHGTNFQLLPEISDCRTEYWSSLWFHTFPADLANFISLSILQVWIPLMWNWQQKQSLPVPWHFSVETEFHLKVVSLQLQNVVSNFIRIKLSVFLAEQANSWSTSAGHCPIFCVNLASRQKSWAAFSLQH